MLLHRLVAGTSAGEVFGWGTFLFFFFLSFTVWGVKGSKLVCRLDDLVEWLFSWPTGNVTLTTTGGAAHQLHLKSTLISVLICIVHSPNLLTTSPLLFTIVICELRTKSRAYISKKPTERYIIWIVLGALLRYCIYRLAPSISAIYRLARGVELNPSFDIYILYTQQPPSSSFFIFLYLFLPSRFQ